MCGNLSESISKSNLLKLGLRFFKKEGYDVEEENPMLEGFSGRLRKFDLIVRKGRSRHGVWIKDWKRTVGINVVIKLDNAAEDVGLSTPIMIGHKFSDHAKAYANRRKITLLTKGRIAHTRRR